MAHRRNPEDIDLRKLAFTLKVDADRWTEAMGRETRFCYRCKVWVDAQAHFSHATGDCLAERGAKK